MKRAKDELVKRDYRGFREAAWQSNKGWLYRLLAPMRDYKCHCWYLTNVDKKHVSTLARFRMRNHRLAIEAGEWLDTPIELENRICTDCGVLEDEAHIVIECPRYGDLRLRYIDQQILGTSNGDAMKCLVALLESCTARVLNNLAIFLKKAI